MSFSDELACKFALAATNVEITALRAANEELRKELEAARADAARYQRMRNLAMKQTAMPGQPFIVMYNGMQGVYNLIGEAADYAVDTSMAQAAIAQEAKDAK